MIHLTAQIIQLKFVRWYIIYRGLSVRSGRIFTVRDIRFINIVKVLNSLIIFKTI